VSRRQPRTPEAAIVSLERIGARVLFPPPDGQPAPPEASWDALAGAAELREQVEEVLVLPLKYPEAFASVRAGTRRLGTDRAAALLFYGPPGTGKTTAARIAAAQAGLPLVYAPLEGILSKWFGQAEQQLAVLFDACAALGRCVVFVDELDALAGSRSRDIDDASRRVLSVLLRRLDGLEAQPGTTLIGATNRRADLDDALLSRFDVRVHFPAPEAAARAEILAMYAKHLTADVCARLGAAAVGLSGRDLLDVCRQAERRWVTKLLKGQVVEPPLPPPAEYEDSLRRRLESSFVKESSRAFENASEQPTSAATSSARPPAAVDAATARWRARRGVANPSALTSTGYPQSPQSLGGNSIVIGPSSSAW
jgi:SpoVK/Ycf46/Vps4 family AAA+-type ATPase